jgi:hypothetical protein
VPHSLHRRPAAGWLSRYDWNQRDFSRRADDLERARIEGYRLSTTAKAVVEPGAGLHLQAGLDWERRSSLKYDNYNPRTEVVVAENDMRDRKVDEGSAFLQFAYSPSRLRFLVGARYNDNDLFGGHVSGRATEARYRLPGNLSSFAAYSVVDGDHGDEVPGTDHYNYKYVPKHTFTGGLVKYFGAFWASGVATFKSEVSAPLETIGGQSFFDLNLGYGHRVGNLVLRHSLSAKNIADDQERVPEYVRRNLNEVPSGYGRRISYLLQVGF